jgi:hypothetical protein
VAVDEFVAISKPERLPPFDAESMLEFRYKPAGGII